MGESAQTVDILLQAKNEASAVFDRVAKDLLGVDDAFSKVSSGVADAAEKFGPLLAVVTATTAAVVGAGKALWELARFSADIGDNLNDLSKRTGIAVETLSVLRLAADQSGTSLGGLAMGFKFLSVNMLQAAHGANGDAEVFAKLGVAVVDASGKLRDTNAVMLDLADKFARMPDGAEKTGLAMQVFGRAAFEIIPFLNEGRAGIEAMTAASVEMGQQWSGDAARAADTFNDTLAEIGAGLSSLKEIIGRDAVKLFQPILDDVRDFLKFTVESFKWAHDQVGAAIDAIRAKLEGWASTLKLVAIALQPFSPNLAAVTKGLAALAEPAKKAADETAKLGAVVAQTSAGTYAAAAAHAEAGKKLDEVKEKTNDAAKASAGATAQQKALAAAHKQTAEAAVKAVEVQKVAAVQVIDIYQQVLQLQAAMFGGAPRGPRYQQDLTLGAHPVVYPNRPPPAPTYLNPAIDPYRSPQGIVLNALANPSMPAPVEVAVSVDGREIARAVQRAVSRGNTTAVPGL